MRTTVGRLEKAIADLEAVGRLEKAIADLEAQNEGGERTAVAHLPEELADKEVLREQVRLAMDDLRSQKRHKRINLTDTDARLMKGRQGIVAGYNAQAMVSPVETEEGANGMLVTAADVVDAANDNALLVPMIKQAEETTGTKAQMTLADAGYFAGSHLAESARLGQQVVVSESRQRFLKDPYHKDQFTYDEQSDSFTCPQGQTLKFVRSIPMESRCVCTGPLGSSVRLVQPLESVPGTAPVDAAWK